MRSVIKACGRRCLPQRQIEVLNHIFGALVALVRVFFQRPHDHGFDSRRHRWVEQMRRRRRFLDVLVEQRGDALFGQLERADAPTIM